MRVRHFSTIFFVFSVDCANLHLLKSIHFDWVNSGKEIFDLSLTTFWLQTLVVSNRFGLDNFRYHNRALFFVKWVLEITFGRLPQTFKNRQIVANNLQPLATHKLMLKFFQTTIIVWEFLKKRKECSSCICTLIQLSPPPCALSPCAS